MKTADDKPLVMADDERIMADDEQAFVRFLDLAGHDLRNPITVLKSQLQLMQRRLTREGDRQSDLRDLARMAYQIERLNTGLDTYLEASRIIQGRFFLVPDMVDLGSLAERVVTLYQTASRSHHITLTGPDEPIVAHWDPSRIELALAILLANAVKYSSEGDITVTITREPEFAQVRVTDHGIGIPTGEEAAIFEQYTSGSNVENSGVGLGLFVARAVVCKHGGEIGVVSSPDDGTSFWFTLPVTDAPTSELPRESVH